MWERAQELVDEAVAVPLADVEEAIRLLASRAHVVAEGAGALALAAALRRDDRCVCIVSGGNIEPDAYARVPTPAATAQRSPGRGRAGPRPGAPRCPNRRRVAR